MIVTPKNGQEPMEIYSQHWHYKGGYWYDASDWNSFGDEICTPKPFSKAAQEIVDMLKAKGIDGAILSEIADKYGVTA